MHANGAQHLLGEFVVVLSLHDETNVHGEGGHVPTAHVDDPFGRSRTAANVKCREEEWLQRGVVCVQELVRHGELFANDGGTAGDHVPDDPRPLRHIWDEFEAFVLVVGIALQPRRQQALGGG